MSDVITQSEYPFRLAAQGGGPSERFSVASFSNEKENIVGRVMQDRHNSEVSFYLMADDKEKVKGRKVKIIDSDLEGITDSQGFVNFGPITEFKCSSVQIQSPASVFVLSPHHVKMPSKSQSHSFLLKNKQHDEIHIDIDKSVETTSYRISIKTIRKRTDKKELQVVAFTDNDRTLAGQARDGVTVMETKGRERILRIHIF